MTAKRIFLVLLIGTILSGCNTIKGIGQDLESTGEAISGTADHTKEKMR